MKSIRVRTVAWESGNYYTICVYVCSLSYTACNAHALYYTYIVICEGINCLFHCVTCVSAPYICTLYHRRHDFLESVIQRKICVWIFSTNLSEIFLILRRIKRERDKINSLHFSSRIVPVIIVRF